MTAHLERHHDHLEIHGRYQNAVARQDFDQETLRESQQRFPNRSAPETGPVAQRAFCDPAARRQLQGDNLFLDHLEGGVRQALGQIARTHADRAPRALRQTNMATGATQITSVSTASAMESGRSTKAKISPRARMRELRKVSSSIGPRTSPRM